MRIWPLSVLVMVPVLIAVVSATWGAAGAAMAPDRYAQIRRDALEHLEEGLWPFWLHNSVDPEYGGFLTELNRDGSVRSGDKMLVAQARQIWAFSHMWNAGYREPRIKEAAQRGLRFLSRHFWDARHEGWFWQCDRDGTPRDMGKRTYGHAFVIYAATEYHRAFENPYALRVAERTFDALERHAKDPDSPGYFGSMDREWRPAGWAAGRTKSMNTQLHLLEALTRLYGATGKPEHGERLREVLDILVQKCYLPQHGCCVEMFSADWTPVPGRRNRYTSYGHNVEMAWLIQEAADALGLPPERYREVGLRLINHALTYGWHERAGALCSNGPLEGKPSHCSMEWWDQAENLIALDWAYRTTGEERYLEALDRQLDWVVTRQSDPTYGGWWDRVSPDGVVISDRKAHIWHAAYHEVRACLRVGAGEERERTTAHDAAEAQRGE
ncbi:MAG: AGE family epimerase/isomerase [Candidatus Brocadiaceae bacterium]